MKNKVVILFLIYLSVNGTAFEVRPLDDLVSVKKVIATSVVEGKDLRVNIGLNLRVPKNFLEYRDNLTIYFRPWQKTNNQPPNVSFEACFTFNGDGAVTPDYDEIDMLCNGKPLVIVSDNGRNAILTIPPFNKTEKFIVVRINYTMPDYIFEQGMYDVVWLHYPNMDCDMTNHVTLPRNTSIPYRFPEDAQIDQPYGRWIFTLNGTKDRFIWYTDAEEIKKHEDDLMKRGALWGALFGFVFSFTLFVIERKLTKRDNERNLEKIEKTIDSKLTRDDAQESKQNNNFTGLSFAILGYLLLKKSLRDKKKGD